MITPVFTVKGHDGPDMDVCFRDKEGSLHHWWLCREGLKFLGLGLGRRKKFRFKITSAPVNGVVRIDSMSGCYRRFSLSFPAPIKRFHIGWVDLGQLGFEDPVPGLYNIKIIGEGEH